MLESLMYILLDALIISTENELVERGRSLQKRVIMNTHSQLLHVHCAQHSIPLSV